MPDEERIERRAQTGQHIEKYPDVPFLEHVSLMVRSVQQEAEIRHTAYVEFMEERYRSYMRESALRETMVSKAEEANKTHFALINGLQARQDVQQREHTADLVRVRGEMASHEALGALRGQMEERINAIATWKIEQQAIQQQRDEAASRRMWLVGTGIGVFSILINLVIRLLTDNQ